MRRHSARVNAHFADALCTPYLSIMVYDLTIVVPTLNEAGNIEPLLDRLDAALATVAWEIIVVDDDSSDGTADAVRQAVKTRDNVRLIVRVGRRGLSGAAIEGMMASTAPYIAVMDGDLQHDETVLPGMLARARQNQLDIVVASRFAGIDRPEGLSSARQMLSRVGNSLSRIVAKADLSDPLSGFFLLHQSLRDETVRDLNGTGFKILLDIFASAKRPLAFTEVPMRFRERHSGESKLDASVMLAFAAMIGDKMVGRFLPIAYIAMAFGILASVGFHLLLMIGLFAGTDMSFMACLALAASLCLAATLWITTRFGPGGGASPAKLAGLAVAALPGLIANVLLTTTLGDPDINWMAVAGFGALVGALWTRATLSIVYDAQRA